MLLNTKETKVKICGITNEEDLFKAAYYGAWAVGFIFHKKSPRYISPSRVKRLMKSVPPFVTPVGVFVNLPEGAVREITRFTGIQTLQFHGDETPDYCGRFKTSKVIKAFRVSYDFNFDSVKKYPVDAYLFDTYKEGVEGGTGEAFNWDLFKGAKFNKPVILSGGLNAENLSDALKIVQPYAVDVSSGVEKSPGLKDPKKIRQFMEVVRTSAVVDKSSDSG